MHKPGMNCFYVVIMSELLAKHGTDFRGCICMHIFTDCLDAMLYS